LTGDNTRPAPRVAPDILDIGVLFPERPARFPQQSMAPK
jgi:hypothetical protein